MIALTDLLDGENGEALEYDILRHGRRLPDLGSAAFPWRDLKLIVEHQGPDSALRRKALPHVDYTYTDVLLNAVLNTLRVVSWQLGGDDKLPKPEPIPLPGQVLVSEGRMADAMSIEEMEARLKPYGPQ